MFIWAQEALIAQIADILCPSSGFQEVGFVFPANFQNFSVAFHRSIHIYWTFFYEKTVCLIEHYAIFMFSSHLFRIFYPISGVGWLVGHWKAYVAVKYTLRIHNRYIFDPFLVFISWRHECETWRFLMVFELRRDIS